MVTVYPTSNPLGSEAAVSARLTFISNDKANHRQAIISLPELKDDTDKQHVKLQHVALVCHDRRSAELLQAYL